MRTLLFTLCYTLSIASFGQGVVSMTVDPASPTTSDNVKVYAELWFPNSGCPEDGLNHTVTGFNIYASAHHCQGMLTMICNATDTFDLGILPAGTYNMQMILTSGMGGPPCTPGFVPNDTGFVSFTVTGTVGLVEEGETSWSLFPNPAQDELTINSTNAIGKAIRISDITGRLVLDRQVSDETMTIGIADLPSGIYIVTVGDFSTKLIVE